MIFQLGIVACSCVIILKTYGQYKKELVSRYWLLAFSTLWVGIALASLVPSATDGIAQAVGVERGVDLFMYSAVLMLVYAVYRLLVRAQKTQREITELVRQIALAHPVAPEQKQQNSSTA